MEDKRLLQGHLMNQHRRLINEISEIKANSFELNEEEKKRIKKLEFELKIVAQRLYSLYNN